MLAKTLARQTQRRQANKTSRRRRRRARRRGERGLNKRNKSEGGPGKIASSSRFRWQLPVSGLLIDISGGVGQTRQVGAGGRKKKGERTHLSHVFSVSVCRLHAASRSSSNGSSSLCNSLPSADSALCVLLCVCAVMSVM